MKNYLCLILCLVIQHAYSQTDIFAGDSLTETNLVLPNGVVVASGQTNDTIPGAIGFIDGEFMGYNGTEWVRLSESKKEIIGTSIGTTDGRVSFNGLHGIEAANEMCKDAFPAVPTARYYFPHDIDEALANNLVSGITNGEFFWSFTHGFNGFLSNGVHSPSRSNNCWCFLFNSGDIADGTVVRFFLDTASPGNGGGVAGNQVEYNYGAPCNANCKIICGK